MGEIEKYLLNLILKERRIIISGAVAGLVLFLLYFFFFYTPLYTSTSNLYIKNIVQPTVVAPLVDNGTIRSESGFSNPLFNLYELIKSEDIAFNVYKRVKEDYPSDLSDLGVVSKESFFSVYLGLVSSKVIPSTDVLTVSLKWPNRKNAKAVLEIVIDEFRKENLEIRRSIDSEKRIYLEQQTEEIADKLEEIREQIKDYKIENELTDAINEANNLMSVRMNLVREISMLKAQIDYNLKKFEEFAKQLNIDDPIIALKAAGVGNDPFLISMSRELASSQQQMAMLKTKFTDKYFQVIELQGKIEELKQNIEERKQETAQNLVLPKAIYDGPSTNIVSQFALVHVERLSQEVMLKSLEEGIQEILEKEKQTHIKRIGLDSLQKQEMAFATAYQNIKAKQLEAKIKENEIVNNILTLKSPTDASLIQLGILTKLVGFLLFGSLAGLGIAYIKQGIEDKWIDIDELKRITDQDILGVIPWLPDETAENARKIYDAAYTNIASEIITKAYHEDVAVVSFISTSINQNKSVVTNNLAELLGALEKQSIIIDFSKNFNNKTDIIDVVNFINHQLKNSEYNKLKIAIGSKSPDAEINGGKQNGNLFEEFYEKFKNELRDMLKNAVITKEVEKDGKSTQLYYLGMGEDKNDLNLKYLVSTKGFSVLLKCLKKEFDFVFINTPHGNFMLPEINFIKKNSEAMVLIASVDSNRETLIKLVNNITESQQKILGIISREKDTEMEKFFNGSSEEDYIEEEF